MTDRAEIRDWLAANLRHSPDAGDRVLERRALPLEKDLLPTLQFSIQNQRSVDISQSGTQERVDLLRVVACVKGPAAEAEAVLDRLGYHVEDALANDTRMGGLIDVVEYQGTEFSVSGDGEKTLNTAAFTFALTYYSRRAGRFAGSPLGLLLLITKTPLSESSARRSQAGIPVGLTLLITRDY